MESFGVFIKRIAIAIVLWVVCYLLNSADLGIGALIAGICAFIMTVYSLIGLFSGT